MIMDKKEQSHWNVGIFFAIWVGLLIILLVFLGTGCASQKDYFPLVKSAVNTAIEAGKLACTTDECRKKIEANYQVSQAACSIAEQDPNPYGYLCDRVYLFDQPIRGFVEFLCKVYPPEKK